MKLYINLTLFIIMTASTFAQETVYPAKQQQGLMYITDATIHQGNGQVIENGTIQINNGKIEAVGANITPVDGAKIITANGKHVYPGLILTNSQLGLIEVNSVRATIDAEEIGEMNPSVRSLVAYNTDSKVIGTLRSNGILLANIVPRGGLISGSSSVVNLDAWNWEDAVYQTDGQIHFTMPNMINRPNPLEQLLPPPATPPADPMKKALEQVEIVRSFLKEAKAASLSVTPSTNLKLDAVKGLFNKSQKLFIHANVVKEMLVAIDISKDLAIDVVIVGGSESYQISQLLKQNNIPVILLSVHNLPTTADDDVDQPYKTPAALQKAGVLFAINDDDGQTRGRNLAFNAGTAAAYGLTKEQALSAITLNAAKILGIDKKTGSIEVGKDANIVISESDILDMRTSIITHAFIQGREVNLTDKHKQLYERYKYKYNLK